jgi:hypothetical protein
MAKEINIPDVKSRDAISCVSTLKEKAGKIFEAMEYEVEYDRCFSGSKIDIFIKKKKILSSRYTVWVCLVDNRNRKVPKDTVDGLLITREVVKKELAKESDLHRDCQAMIISEMGFTKEARAAARKYRLALKTLESLSRDKDEFIKEQEKRRRYIDDLLRNSADINQWVPERLSDHCLAHLILLRVLRMLVKNHRDWENLEYGCPEKKAVDIIKLVGYNDW